MKKHISEVELWRQGFTPDEEYQRDEPPYHRDEFCLLCGYFMEGDRLYMEIHGSNGALNRVKDIDSSQPYACMECYEQFQSDSHLPDGVWKRKYLTDFIKERKK